MEFHGGLRMGRPTRIGGKGVTEALAKRVIMRLHKSHMFLPAFSAVPQNAGSFTFRMFAGGRESCPDGSDGLMWWRCRS